MFIWTQVRRVQSYVDTVDKLKARNCGFESGVGSLNSATPFPASTVITENWEHFE